MKCHFRVLGIGLTAAAPAEILGPIAHAYRRFAVAEHDSVGSLEITLASPQARSMKVGGRDVELVPDLDTSIQFYQHFLSALMDRVDSHAVLHAAALVDERGGAVILAAPSGHGKSSTTLELAHRGLRFLSDDYAPLDMENRTVWPYHRTVGLVVDRTSPLPEELRPHAEDPGGASMFGKRLVDIGELLGEQALAHEPSPLRNVILLTSHGIENGELPATTIDLASRSTDAEELQALFEQTDGVEIVRQATRPHMSLWRLRLERDRQPTDALGRVLDSDRIVLLEKRWDVKPDFGAPPAARSIKKREAAEFLGRELLNRRSGSRLLARHGDSLAALFLHLAGALRDADCWKVSVGGCRETADLIQRLISGKQGDSAGGGPAVSGALR